ncbi:MAG: hypothetical protein A2161_20555 [Candidatus Schekmanbacteria bacterium RBG_13_48_7]|uniref:DUF362 domain-containing protein n=1 Tax=Candidatus Schekmanbacteria bacterium RBG_13_48_7 TaxID=1817878 RepID=A0A1F7RN07_9BACT|nr:MAG: hypothetical protein A2161_20555 [Candidatus Schekmanbacteria bacterium RBG_13_48_7]
MRKKEIVSVNRRDHIPESPLKYTVKSIRIIQNMLDELVNNSIKFKHFIQNKRVLIKPNLVRPYLKTSPAITTDPRVTISLIRLLKDYGASEIAIGENPGYGLKAMDAFKAMKLISLCKKMEVTLIPFDDCETVIKKNPKAYVFKEIEFPSPVFEYDVLLNLPKMKTHMHTLVTLGMKNMQGVILDHQRLLYHRDDIHHKIVDTVLLANPHFTIVDGIWAMEGQAPFFGETIRNMNTLVAGENVAAVDTVAAIIMGFEPEEIATICLAREMGFKGTKLNEITIHGCKIESITRRFRRPVVSSVGVFPNIRCIQGGVCNGCKSALRHSLDKLQIEGKLKNKPEMTIFLGRPQENYFNPDSWTGDLWIFGDCAEELTKQLPGTQSSFCHLKGCPPHVLDLYKWFCNSYKDTQD